MPVTEDRRPRVYEPPPVRILAVDDVRLPTLAGLERKLDAFYVELLAFERDVSERRSIAYHAEKHRICLEVVEALAARDDYRPIGIEVPSIQALREKLDELEIEYEWQHSITPGMHQILIQDPAGNWLSIQSARFLL